MNEHVSSQLCCINMNSIVFTMRQLSFVCEIMQLAAFPLRNQRNLRENWPFTCKGRARNEWACSLTALLYKHELHSLCVISEICGRIGRSHIREEQGKNKEWTRNEQACSHTALLHKHELHCLHYVATVFSLRNNAACCIPLRNQRYLRENIHMRVLNLLAQRKPQCLPQISLIYADKTTITIPDETHIFL